MWMNPIQHSKNIIQHNDIWNYKIPRIDIIDSKVPGSLIALRRESIANFIGAKGYKIIETSVYRGEEFMAITYRTKRLSLLRRIKNVFL